MQERVEFKASQQRKQGDIMIDQNTFPAAFAAMDAAAAQFWAYPNADWQDEFLLAWARENDPGLLAALTSATQ